MRIHQFEVKADGRQIGWIMEDTEAEYHPWIAQTVHRSGHDQSLDYRQEALRWVHQQHELYST